MLTDKQFHLLPLLLAVPALVLGLCVLGFQLLESRSPSREAAVGARYISKARSLSQSASAVAAITKDRNQPVDWTALESVAQVEAETPEAKPAEKVEDELVLQGIAWDAIRPLAFLNDQVLTVNDHLNGFQVTEIRENTVVLVDANGKGTTLRLYSDVAGGKENHDLLMP